MVRPYKSHLGVPTVNPLPDDQISDWSKLQAFADDKLNVTQNIKVVFLRIENIVGKEENAGYQHFLLFLQYFQKVFSSRASKVVIVWLKVKLTIEHCPDF